MPPRHDVGAVMGSPRSMCPIFALDGHVSFLNGSARLPTRLASNLLGRTDALAQLVQFSLRRPHLLGRIRENPNAALGVRIRGLFGARVAFAAPKLAVA